MEPSSIFPTELPFVHSIRHSHPTQTATTPAYVLALAARGTRVRVTGVRGDAVALEKRLAAMGIRIGSELEIVQHEGSAVVVRIGETRLAIGIALVHRLLVTSMTPS